MIEQSIDEVWPGIFISSYIPAWNREILKSKNIKYIINLSEYGNPWPDMTYFKIDIADSPSEKIYKYFDPTYLFIKEGLKKGNVLVHCMAGISRSVTIVMAYLIRKEKLKVHDALTCIRLKRPVANPNQGFLQQLQHYY